MRFIPRPRSALLPAFVLAFLASYPLAEARAAFTAYGQVYLRAQVRLLLHNNYSENEDLSNTANLAGVEVEVEGNDSLSEASAFASVLPRQAGAPLNSPYVWFRGAATVTAEPTRLDSFDVFDEVRAYSISSWSDVLHFEPISVQAAQISAWGVILDLSGQLIVTGNARSRVRFDTTWGGGGGYLEYEQIGPGSQTFLHHRSPVIRSLSDPFAAEGIPLTSTFSTFAVAGFSTQGLEQTAAAHFGHTGEFPGLFALDAQGNILPDAAAWVKVTSDSGLEYGILSQLPSVSAVPEPSTLTMFGIGTAWVLVAGVFRRRRQLASR